MTVTDMAEARALIAAGARLIGVRHETVRDDEVHHGRGKRTAAVRPVEWTFEDGRMPL